MKQKSLFVIFWLDSGHPRSAIPKAKCVVAAVQMVCVGQQSCGSQNFSLSVDTYTVDTLKLCPLILFPQHDVVIVPDPYQFGTFGVQIGGSTVVRQPTQFIHSLGRSNSHRQAILQTGIQRVIVPVDAHNRQVAWPKDIART